MRDRGPYLRNARMYTVRAASSLVSGYRNGNDGEDWSIDPSGGAYRAFRRRVTVHPRRLTPCPPRIGRSVRDYRNATLAFITTHFPVLGLHGLCADERHAADGRGTQSPVIDVGSRRVPFMNRFCHRRSLTRELSWFADHPDHRTAPKFHAGRRGPRLPPMTDAPSPTRAYLPAPRGRVPVSRAGRP